MLCALRPKEENAVFGLIVVKMDVSFSEIKEKEEVDPDTLESNLILVTPGEVITTEQGFLKYAIY